MIQGFGLGLRTDHYTDFIERKPRLDWLEIISENYMIPGGKPLHYLDRIRADYPMVMHGVSMSIGSLDPLNFDYLRQLKALADRVEPGWISDHLCWTGIDHTNLHDLLPLPYTEEALHHLTGRILRVQEFLGRRILLENVSTYVACNDDEMSEWQFIRELSARADCELLLDVNNVYVSARNHGFDAHEFIDAMPAGRVRQIHLAGHQDHGDCVIDTHDHPIRDEVFELYAYAIERLGPVASMIERDDRIPPLDELLAELDLVRKGAEQVLARRSPCSGERMNASLARWQRQFMQGILTRGLPGMVRSGGAASAQRRFDIYVNAYRTRLIDALRANYPVLHRALGDDAFESLAQAYIAAHPSSCTNIRWFGDQLDTFAGKHSDLVSHPALVDLIRLEWALRGAFDAPDRALLDAAALAGVAPTAWPDLILELHPCVRLVALDWQVETLWHAAQTEGQGEPEAPLPGFHHTLVWRRGLNSYFRSLEASEAALIKGLAAAENFAQICERAVSYAADSATELAVSFLQRWLEDGLLAGSGPVTRINEQ